MANLTMKEALLKTAQVTKKYVDSQFVFATEDDINNLFLIPLYAKFKVDKAMYNKTLQVYPPFPIMPITTYVGSEEPIVLSEEFEIKYIVNEHEIIITHDDISFVYYASEGLYMENVKQDGDKCMDLIDEFANHLVDGENIIEIYDMKGTIKTIDTTPAYYGKDTNNIEWNSCITEIIDFTFSPQQVGILELGVSGGSLDAVIQNLDISKLTSLELMFADTANVESIDLSSWDVSHINNAKMLFNRCPGLKSISIAGWQLQDNADYGFLFNDCKDLEYLDLSNVVIGNDVNLQYMFDGCVKLTRSNINLTGVSAADIAKLEAAGMPV